VNPLESPGEVDLTADVDFGELRKAVEGKCLAYVPVDQRPVEIPNPHPTDSFHFKAISHGIGSGPSSGISAGKVPK
jgi:hypothetical protein